MSGRIVALESRVAILDADLPGLQNITEQAEASLIAAKKALAQSEVDAMAAELQGVSAQIVTALTEAARLIAEHAQAEIAMQELARKYGLPTPARCRWLLPSKLIRSKGAEMLRGRLDVRHALGGIKEASARPV